MPCSTHTVFAAETLNINAPALIALSCWLFVSSSVTSVAPVTAAWVMLSLLGVPAIMPEIRAAAR